MLTPAKIYFLIFGVLTIAGGIIGYVKAGSTPSIIAGSITGILLLIGAWLLPEHRAAGGCSCGMIEGRFAELIAGQRQGVLVTLRKDGRPQLSNVNYAWYPEEQTIRVSTTDDRAKTGNMRRDPRVSFHVTSGDFWSYVVVDGHAELSEVARDPHDAAVEELVDLYRAVQGDHPDWDDYRAAMVRDRRLVVRLRAERAYGMVHRG